MAGRRPRVNLKVVDDARILRLLYPEADRIQAERPRTRADCIDGPRPCPWVGCRHHLYLTVDEKKGALTLNFPGTEVWDLKHSCALDVAGDEVDGLSLEELGGMTMLTRERTRQIEVAAIESMDGEVDAQPPSPAPPVIRSRQHKRIAAAIRRMTATLLRIARQNSSTSIRTFTATLELARSLADVASVIAKYLATDPKLDVRAAKALRGLACAASATDPMAWPIHLLDVTRELTALDAELVPGGAGTVTTR
mgnify:FL=1